MTQTAQEVGRLASRADDEQPPLPEGLVPYTKEVVNGMPSEVFTRSWNSEITAKVLWYLCNRWSWSKAARWESARSIAWRISGIEGSDTAPVPPEKELPDVELRVRSVQLSLKALEEAGLIAIVKQKWGWRTSEQLVIWCLWLIPGGTWSGQYRPARPKPDPSVNLKVVRPPKGRRKGAMDCAKVAAQPCTEKHAATSEGAESCATGAQSVAPPSYMDCSKLDFETKPTPSRTGGSVSGSEQSDGALSPAMARFKNLAALASGSAGDRCERPETPAAGAGPVRTSTFRTPAEMAAETRFSHPVARKIFSIAESEGERVAYKLARKMAILLREPDSIGFHQDVVAALFAGIDRELVAEAFDVAMAWKKDPKRVKKNFLRYGFDAPRSYFGQVVWPHVKAMKNATPGVDWTRSRDVARNDDRQATVSPGT